MQSCETPVSYAEEEINDQISTGLSDPEIQKDVLAQRQQLSTTEELIAFVEDREAGKRSQIALTPSTMAVSKISQYKRGKTKLSDSRSPDTGRATTTEICSYCGEAGHGRRSTRLIRKQQCPAYSRTCESCGIQGHLSKMCRKKLDTKVDAIE